MSPIDTTGMSEGKKAALELTESSREAFYDYPTFAGAIFMGELQTDLIYPCSEMASDRDARGRRIAILGVMAGNGSDPARTRDDHGSR